MAHAFTPNTCDAEAGGSLFIRDQPTLQSVSSRIAGNIHRETLRVFKTKPPETNRQKIPIFHHRFHKPILVSSIQTHYCPVVCLFV